MCIPSSSSLIAMASWASRFSHVDLQDQDQLGMATPKYPAPSRTASDGDSKNVSDIFSELCIQFHDFDDRDQYRRYKKQATSEEANNFAVRFGLDKAQIAIDLKEPDLKTLLQAQAERKDEQVTWINVWSPGKQKGILEAIGNKYNFSTRLRETIANWDDRRQQVAQSQDRKSALKKRSLRAARAADAAGPRPRLRSTFQRVVDPEKGIGSGSESPRRVSEAPACVDDLDDSSSDDEKEDLDMYRLVQDQYNYTTIDHGPNFVCIGANWLHHRPKSSQGSEEPEDIYRNPKPLVPRKHWAWYVLTNEGTVISIHEAPNHEKLKEEERTDPQQFRMDELKNIRKNTAHLLCQLSRPGMERYRKKVSTRKGVRSDLLHMNQAQGGPVTTARTTALESSLAVDASANLFYYLFEDYTAATAILTHSSENLAKVTNDVLHITDRKNKDKDSSDIIKLLYARSKDLRQLKHLFESYENLIKGIKDLGIDTANDERDLYALAASNGNLSGGGTPPRGVKLSQKAFDRFDRLSIRLRLLMLDTIDEYLAEKASLSDTYFNLMSQKDSQATSKLNRSASLLAKLSVFFLPISFMTSYFSVQVPDLTDGFTGETYWVTFAVIASLSFMSLFFFSKLLMFVSDVLDEKVAKFQEWVGGGLYKIHGIFARNAAANTHAHGEGGDDDVDGKDEEKD